MGKYKVVFSLDAEEHLRKIKKSGDKSAMNKISRLLIEMAEHPESGTGRPEQLKHEFQGLWSRRIDKKSRIIYEIQDGVINVFGFLGHYGDK